MITINNDPTPHRLPADEVNAIFQRLRQLKARCHRDRVSKVDRTVTLIDACILEGFDYRSRILGALKTIGLNRQHVAHVLETGTGPFPERHYWRQDVKGRYSKHPLQLPAL